MIEWKEDYNIGINLIDNQHKKLFSIANEAYALIKDDFRVDKYDKIVAILQELKDYTAYHFNSEEEYMEKIHYPKFFSQKVEHNAFINKINKIDLTQIDENQDKYILNILDFIVNWITNHIISKDKLIKENC